MTQAAITWEQHQTFEREYWGDCVNTFSEENKQISIAHRWGLEMTHDRGRWPSYDLGGRSVVDIGGGPVSLLLKCRNRGQALVVDPCCYPDWTVLRYASTGVRVFQGAAEEWEPDDGYDEAWVYNVLQHVQDPVEVVARARAAARVVRVFEWLHTSVNLGHPHTFDATQLDLLFDVIGTVEDIDENGNTGRVWYGVFPQ